MASCLLHPQVVVSRLSKLGQISGKRRARTIILRICPANFRLPALQRWRSWNHNDLYENSAAFTETASVDCQSAVGFLTGTDPRGRLDPAIAAGFIERIACGPDA